MKVLLVNPSSSFNPYRPKMTKPPLRIPYGLAYVGSALLHNDVNVSVWDRNAEPSDIKTTLKRQQPDVLGLSVLTGRAILDAINISEKAKEIYPDVPIVWGGYHSTLLPEQTLREPYIDYVVSGDGEYTMMELVRAIENGSPVKNVAGLYYKKHSKIKQTKPRPLIQNLDELPFPAWHLFKMEKYIHYTAFNERQINLNTSRGCPFNCAFCCEPIFHKRRWRYNSSHRVIAMIRFLKDNYKCDHITFRESLFVANIKRVEQICDRLIAEKLGIGWDCPARIMNWDRALLTKMKKSGCTSFEFGIETGSPRLLKLLNKQINLDQVEDTFRKCNEVGIIACMNLIVGLPTETRKDLEMTLSLINKLKHGIVAVFIFTPFPGTKLYDFVVEERMFVPPQTLRDWGEFNDKILHGESIKPFGEVSRRELTGITQRVRDKNARIVRKLILQKLLKNPGKLFGFTIGITKHAYTYALKSTVGRHREFFEAFKNIA